MVWYRTSDVYQRHVLGQERAALLEEALAAIAAAKAAGCHVNLFMPESTRMELGQLRGTVVFTLVDSLAITRSTALGYLVREVVALTDRPVEVHCHNDYGLATACVLAAYESGTSALNCSVNAVGYRAGNAALDEVAPALEALYGVDTGLRLELLPWVAHLVSEITRIPLGYFKGVTGRGAMRVE